MAEEEQLDILGDDSFTESLLEHLDKVPTDEIRNHWPQDAAALLDIFVARLQRMGVAATEQEAVRMAMQLLTDAAEYGGGRNWYLPSKRSLLQLLRDQQIYRESRRMPVRDLVKKHRVTEAHIYRIIAQQQRLNVKRTQRDLF